MNEFSTGGFAAAVAATNGLIGQLARREHDPEKWVRLPKKSC